MKRKANLQLAPLLVLVVVPCTVLLQHPDLLVQVIKHYFGSSFPTLCKAQLTDQLAVQLLHQGCRQIKWCH